MTGKTSVVDGTVLQGQCISFYPTGKRQQIASYKNGRLYGDAYSYYPNGQLYAVKNYIGNDVFSMIACNDSTGKALANDGNGHFIEYDPDLAFIREEGDITNGTKNGEWHGFFMDGPNKVTYTETYKDGDLMIGHSQKKGKQYIYASREISPEYKGGEDNLKLFVKSHLRYPDFAVKANIQGSVFVRFYIEADGSVTEAKAERAADITLANEAVRVIELTRWIPGYHYGMPARTQSAMPINFSLRTK